MVTRALTAAAAARRQPRSGVEVVFRHAGGLSFILAPGRVRQILLPTARKKACSQKWERARSCVHWNVYMTITRDFLGM